MRTARAGGPARRECPPTLRIGSRGPSVKVLQELLNQHLKPNPQLTPDGVFGQATQAAVIRFQMTHRIGADGIIGPLTWAYLPTIKTAGLGKGPVEEPNGYALKATITQIVVNNQPVNPKPSTPAAKAPPPLDIEHWSIKDKLIEAMRRAVPKVPAEMRDQFAALLSPVNIGITAAALTVWAVGHFFGASEIADAVLLAAAWFFVGRAALDFVSELGQYADTAIHAKTEPDLENAAQHLANAVSIVTVTVFMVLLAKAAKPTADAAGKTIKEAGEKVRGTESGRGGAPSSPEEVPPGKSTTEEPQGLKRGIRRKVTQDENHVDKHLPDTPQSKKLIRKEGAAHVFKDRATMDHVADEIIKRGEFTGEVRGAKRYGLRFDEPIGYRVGADGSKIPLYYGEMKVVGDQYHVIPRTGPSK
jgi:hypothetical protein